MNVKQKKIVGIVLAIALITIVALVIYLSIGRKNSVPETQNENGQAEVTQEAAPTPTQDPHAGMVRSKLTGEWVKPSVAKKRPYAVMINNIEYAFLRQKGTSKADILYEALAEGGITRMLAVYEDVTGVEKIGSVRSARHYYVQFAQEWDAIFCHFGHTKYAVSKMDALGTNNLSGLSAIGGVVYARDSGIAAPHNVYTSGAKLKKGAKKLKYSTTKNESAMAEHFQFYEEDTDLSSGKKAKNITIPFSAYSTCQMKYDTQKKVYRKYEYGKKQMDIQYKKQLKFKNVIIQLVDESNIDSNGYQTMGLKNASGNGYYYTNGKRMKITWKRRESSNTMAYYDESGNVLTVNPGKTYIAVYPKSRSKLIK